MARRRFTRPRAEAEVRRLLRRPLKNELSLLHWAERCVLAYAQWFEELDEQRPHQKVLAALLARMAGDLRVMHLCAERGYTLQLMSVAAATFEVAFSIAYVSDDDKKANEWLAWSRPDRLPWRWRTLVAGGLEKAVGSARFRGIQQEETIYGALCRAKHGNPGLQKRMLRATSDLSYVMNVDPLLTPAAPRSLMMGIYLAMRAPVVALLALGQVEAYHSLVGPDAEEIAKGWFRVEGRIRGRPQRK